MKRTDIKKIMIIGSGPIIIGQGSEFDYAGTQACLALKEEGYEVVLINSNPATIMTDTNIADKIYMEPLTLEYISKIIQKERVDAIIPGLGGQTGLNLIAELAKKGVLKQYQVEVLGTSLESIAKGEDRELFKKLCIQINEPIIESLIASTIEEAYEHAKIIGFPLVIRPAFTLGGTGGGFANNNQEFKKIALNGLKQSPTNQILVEKSVYGYKEIEFEVMRDKTGLAISICDMENIDPVGIHTGDSMVVAPSMSLNEKTLEMLKTSALKMINALEIEGGCNVQFALHPTTNEYFLIEVNPRVSRSSALASKATAYPIAFITAKIAVGYTLEELQICDQNASISPNVKYKVIKLARFPFDKFLEADRLLTTQMKATGETMALGNTFEEAFLKGIRSLEIKQKYLYDDFYENKTEEELLKIITKADDERIFAIASLIRKNTPLLKIFNATFITEIFLEKIKNIIDFEIKIKNNINDLQTLKDAKIIGFSDIVIAKLWNTTQKSIYELRQKNNITANFHIVDACSTNKELFIPYLYSTYSKNNKNIKSKKEKIIILGSGPIRIGQGVEFDYSTVHAIKTVKEAGYEAIVINNNPETISTDYTISDKLYFEPLEIEEVMNIVNFENPIGVITQLGGQTAINLTQELVKYGVNILGTSNEAINKAENREQFSKIVKKLNIMQPKGKTITKISEGIKVSNEIGYPVLLRPSFVLGGRAMQIIYNDEQIEYYLKNIVNINEKNPVLIDKYINGKEVEVDALCDGEDVFIPAILEHIERTGIHSGDSITVYPSSLSNEISKKIHEYTKILGLEIGIIGLFNIQFIIENDEIFIIELNPRSSRSVPFLSKITNTNLSEIATKIILNQSLKQQNIKGIVIPNNKYYVKVPVFSFAKLLGVNTTLSPEMKSTGEAMGYDTTLPKALYKALIASGMKISKYGTVFLTIADQDKEEAYYIAKRFYDLGFNLVATKNTALFLKEKGLKVKTLQKIKEDENQIIDAIKEGHITYIINTLTSNDINKTKDGFIIRRLAVENNIPCLTALDTANALLDVLNEIILKVGLINE